MVVVGLVQVASEALQATEDVQRIGDFGSRLAERLALQLQRFQKQLLGRFKSLFVKMYLASAEQRQGTLRGTLRAEFVVDVCRSVEQLQRAVIEPQAAVNVSHDVQQIGSNLRLVRQLTVHARDATVQQFSHPKILAAGFARVAGGEQLGEELGNLQGLLGFRQREIALVGQSDAVDHRQAEDRERRQRDRHRLRSVSLEILPDAVAPRVGRRAYRLLVEVPPHIVGQVGHRGISSLRLFAQRHQADVVQVAGRNRRAGGPAAHALAGTGRSRLQNRSFQLAGLTLAVERMLSRDQFVEQHPQAVDIGRRGDRCTGQLLRCSVGRRQGHDAVSSQVVGGRNASLIVRRQQLGDTEIEQFDPASFADQDIARLEIAMDNEVAVSVMDRVTDGEKGAQAILQQRLGHRVQQGASLDVFHGEPRSQAIVSKATVDQPSDAVMAKAGEDLAFG